MAHETTLEDHRELLKTHEKLNLEQEHGFLEAINDDLRETSSSYIAKCLLLSTYMPQVKSSNKSKKDSSSSSTTKKYTSVMIRVCHSRSRFLSCMYIHDDFMT